MIDLRAGLGAPPITFPGVRMQHADAPPGLPGSAPIMPPAQVAARALNGGMCIGCPDTSSIGIGDLRSWWSRIPMWVKIGAGVVLAAGTGYGVYRLVR